jgi:hypothetical protein
MLSTLPVRAKTRKQTITPDRTPGLLSLSNPGQRQTAIFHYREFTHSRHRQENSKRPYMNF